MTVRLILLPYLQNRKRVIPPVQESRGLGGESSVTRSSGYYSIQNPKKKKKKNLVERRNPTPKKVAPKEVDKRERKRKISGTYSVAHKEKPVRRDRVSSKLVQAISPPNNEPEVKKPRVSGSYQMVKSKEQSLRREEIGLIADVATPRPARSGLGSAFRKILGRESDSEIGTSGEQWLGDKPEGDKYWTVAADDSQREDHSIWTLLVVFVILSFLMAFLLWLLIG